METSENLLSKTTNQNSEIFYPNSPWVCVIKVCLSGGPICSFGSHNSLYNLNIESSQNIDRARLAENSARKDEKTLFWPPPISLVWLPNRWETIKSRNK